MTYIEWTIEKPEEHHWQNITVGGAAAMSDKQQTIDDLIKRICRDFLYYHANEVDAVLKEDIEAHYREREREAIERAKQRVDLFCNNYTETAIAAVTISILIQELGLEDTSSNA